MAVRHRHSPLRVPRLTRHLTSRRLAQPAHQAPFLAPALRSAVLLQSSSARSAIQNQDGSFGQQIGNATSDDHTIYVALAGDTDLLTGGSGQDPGSSNGGNTAQGNDTTPLVLSGSSNLSAFVINVTYDASVNNAPAAFKTDIAEVVQFYESVISTPITLNIDVGYGEIDGSSLQGSLGSSLILRGSIHVFAIKNALASNASSSTDATALASLPSSDPTNGGSFYVTVAQAQALGLITGNGLDGYIGFSSTSNIFDYNNSDGVSAGQYDFFGAVAHEISEVMGRMIPGAGAYSIMDLFDYTAAGTRDLSGTPPGYFSINGGTDEA